MSSGIADEVINAVYNFVVKHIEKINTQNGYTWKDNELFVDNKIKANKIKNYEGTAIGNLLEKFETSGHTPIERTLDLRGKLHSLWNEEKDHNKELSTIAEWYIKEWGGITSIKSETCSRFIIDALEEKSNVAKNIASYSKLMAIVNPRQFAIFDARVCFSLYIIQIYANIDPNKLLKFQRLETRGSIKLPSIVLEHYILPETKEASYQDYLDLLKVVVDKLKSDNSWDKTKLRNYWNDDYYIQIVEMALFWQAKNLAEKLDNCLKNLLMSNNIKNTILKTLQN